MKKAIAIIGGGFVGMSNAAALAKFNDVTIYDVDEKRVRTINQNVCPVYDPFLQSIIDEGVIKLVARDMSDLDVLRQHDLYILCLPTDTSENGTLDLSVVKRFLNDLSTVKDAASIVIRSTLPVGSCRSLSIEYSKHEIYFVPEFLQEGSGLKNALEPDRIIIGSDSIDTSKTQEVVNLFKSITLNTPPILIMGTAEAEASKLFANTYLAMRVAFFNELDNFCWSNNLDPKTLIEGVCSDGRIGDFYNNPSFGYGGYCLPKDTKQVISQLRNEDSTLIKQIEKSNSCRLISIIEMLKAKRVKTVGIFDFSMKVGSDTVKESATISLLRKIVEAGYIVNLLQQHDHLLEHQNIRYYEQIQDLIKDSDVVIENRRSSIVPAEKSFSRDIFKRN